MLSYGLIVVAVAAAAVLLEELHEILDSELLTLAHGPSGQGVLCHSSLHFLRQIDGVVHNPSCVFFQFAKGRRGEAGGGRDRARGFKRHVVSLCGSLALGSPALHFFCRVLDVFPR